MAKAVGVTEKELAAMMKSGQLLADEVYLSSLDN
jgi:tape measure domain-containing protein